ncbi:hypothetical protein F3Y22_tig00116974pilonHSYRG00154 [Hibiscus syriacus]|uniref:RNase H type-1 domain-containing protein n=1 Tax=Hibiscus syriacus TaxID=106335 RepID=A0A6A2XVP2_HIBSY|nr:hypothetical protein F3Y22_tig00116974pilonHSYRG00154 [Hibiscus syriacus]
MVIRAVHLVGQTLPNIRLFGWRLAHEALPTGRFSQHVTHAHAASCGEWLAEMSVSLPCDQFTDLLVLLYHLRMRRNTFVHEGKRLPGWHIVVSGRAMQPSYMHAASLLDSHDSHTIFTSLSKPVAGITKINVDGAFCSTTHSSTVGLVARDRFGSVIAAHAVPLESLTDSSHVEAAAITQGLLLALELNCSRVIVESDAANVVSQLLFDGIDLFVLQFHLSDARSLFPANPHIVVRHVR